MYQRTVAHLQQQVAVCWAQVNRSTKGEGDNIENKVTRITRMYIYICTMTMHPQLDAEVRQLGHVRLQHVGQRDRPPADLQHVTDT